MLLDALIMATASTSSAPAVLDAQVVTECKASAVGLLGDLCTLGPSNIKVALRLAQVRGKPNIIASHLQCKCRF